MLHIAKGLWFNYRNFEVVTTLLYASVFKMSYNVCKHYITIPEFHQR